LPVRANEQDTFREGDETMRVVKIMLIGIIVSVFLVGQAYSAPKGNNGKANNGNANNGNANNGNTNNGNSQAAKVNKGNNKVAAQNKGQAAVHKQQARRSSEANRKREERNRSSDHKSSLSKGNSDLAFNNRDSRGNSGRRNGENGKNEQSKKAVDLLNAFDHARWSYNPHDTRGQGNMGKVDMQDPFGFDRDSDRKELYGNNGRPIREKEEEVVDVAQLTTVDFQIVDGYLAELQTSLDWYLLYYPQYTWIIDYYQSRIDSYSLPYDKISVIDTGEHIDYTLVVPKEFAGENLLITTTLVSVSDYEDWFYSYYVDIPFGTNTGILESQEELYGTHLQISVGDILVEDTQEITMNEDGTYSVSYDPPIELVGDYYGYGLTGGYLAELSVTVTDPDTGASYTTTYDRQINLYRCPYGKVANKITGETIVGAKITVHFEDDSIVSLDKATNKTHTNPQMTDATGRFGFILQSNRKYYMTAKAEGYEDYQSEIFTEQWHVLREDIEMVPVQEQMASN